MLIGMLRAVAALALPLLLLTGCSSPAPAKPVATASASSKAAVTEAAVREPAEATCTDAKGDGGGFDIRDVQLARVGSLERVTLTVSDLPAITADGTAGVVVTLFDTTGNHGVILTTKWIGTETSVGVFDVDASMNHPYSDGPIVDGKTITMTYPADVIDKRAGAGWLWMVTTTLDGNDVDSCKNASWKAAAF